jgi:cell division protein FtsW (lipid II flippase)
MSPACCCWSPWRCSATVKGARRWLNLGFMRIQPSELMKIAMPLMLAWFFQKREAMPRLRDYGCRLLLLLPVGLIARQPDLGTAILVLAAGFYVIFFAGLSWKIMIGMAVAGDRRGAAGLEPAARLPAQPHLTLIDPEKDPLGKGFHIIQSTIAIGSGGIFGKGWKSGTQAQLEFIPERHTDFIFAVFSEEFGLFGNLMLLVLYALLIGRGLMIAANAATLFSRLLAGAVTMIFLHLRLREHGHGGRHPARGRRAAAADQLRRHGAGHAVHRHRHPDVDPRQSDAGAEVIRLALLILPLLVAAAAPRRRGRRSSVARRRAPP